MQRGQQFLTVIQLLRHSEQKVCWQQGTICGSLGSVRQMAQSILCFVIE